MALLRCIPTQSRRTRHDIQTDAVGGVPSSVAPRAEYEGILTSRDVAKPAFTVDELPDQAGRVAIVTGGNTGIGKATCEVLLTKNCKVYLAARSATKAQDAITDLKAKTGKTDVHFLQLDLSDLSTIKGSVNDFLSKEKQLHLLFNNAGVMIPPTGSKTVQDYELQFGTNVVGPFLFTKLLLPTLVQTAQTVKAEGRDYNIVRVINTSSNGHLFAPKGGVNWDNPNDVSMAKWTLYGQSKWCNVVVADEIAKRYGDKGINAHSLNPGAIKTELQRHTGFLERTILAPILNPPSMGCLTQIYAGLAPEAGKPTENGSYYIPWGRKGIKRDDVNADGVGNKL